MEINYFRRNLRKSVETNGTHGNPWKPMKFNENQWFPWESTEIRDNQWKPWKYMKTDQVQWESTNSMGIYGIFKGISGIHGILWKPMEFNENQ